MKYKYYFRKPKSEIIKDILKLLFWGGALCFAASSPYFVVNLKKGLKQWLKNKKYQNNKFSNAFYRLNKMGYIKIEKKNNQLYIHLTKEGRKKAGWMQIDELKIKKPKKWDKKWRLIMFDISELKRLYRSIFRGKLKELGFHPFQKSVWIHPFDCEDEINLLKDFFGLNDKELRLIITDNIGENLSIKEIFKLK